MIELKNVFYSYEGIKALNNIDLKIDKGEAVSLLGPNGSGKSTLLKLINGIISPDSGIYKFNDDEINRKKLRMENFPNRFIKRSALSSRIRMPNFSARMFSTKSPLPETDGDG